MRGHQPLLDMRRAGRAPSSVSFTVDAADPMANVWSRFANGAHIEIDRADSISMLDLRCVVRMVVMVDGGDRDRCVALHRACRAARAKTVATHVMRRGANGDLECWLQLFNERVTHEAE